MVGSINMTHSRLFVFGLAFVFGVIAVGFVPGAAAQEPQTIGRNADWIAYI